MTKEVEEKPHYHGHRQRLRDKFLVSLGKDMPDYEFLELLLTFAIPRRDVKPLAKDLIKKFGNFNEVISAPIEKLQEVEGLKETSIAALKLVKEASIRLMGQGLKNSDMPIINNWDAMVNYCRSAMTYNDVEEFRVLFLDAKNRLICDEVQQRGTVNYTPIIPREVIKLAMNKNASAIIMAHNHPTGDVTPSKQDIVVTKNIKEALDAVGISLHDHIIISKYDVYSFRDRGLI